MPMEQPVISNLDRLNRNVAPLSMKKFALGGVIPEMMARPRRDMIFPMPPPFVPAFGSGLGKRRMM